MPTPVNQILFPTDFSDAAQHAFGYALRLARAYGCRLSLLHVIYPEYEALDLPVMAARATREKVEAAKVALESFRDLGMDRAAEQGMPIEREAVELSTEVGSAAAVIARVARRDEVDVIVMGMRGSHNALERTFGSVSTGVLERASCPVWLLPESGSQAEPEVVLYATDFEEPDLGPAREAIRLVQGFGVDFHVAHIRKAGLDVEPADFADWEALGTEAGNAVSISLHDRMGESVEDALEQLIQELDADLLVMYGPHHNLLERIFTSSHTRQMARRSAIPLLVIKDGQ